MTKDRFVKHMPCKHCGSSDGVGMYSNGIGKCFVCGKVTVEKDRETDMPEPKTPVAAETLETIESYDTRGVQ